MTVQTKTIRIKTGPAPRVFGDELFPPEVFPGGLITCRVCERIELVCIGHPALLCGACLSNLSATAAHVAHVYGAALAFFIEASEALRAAVLASPERDWWAKVDAARLDGDARFVEAWQRAKNSGGEKARLCAMWEALDAEAAHLEPLNAWYTAVERELKTARAAQGEPVAL